MTPPFWVATPFDPLASSRKKLREGPVLVKTCRKCGEVKPAAEFPGNRPTLGWVELVVSGVSR
jgi:hypothetical protein